MVLRDRKEPVGTAGVPPYRAEVLQVNNMYPYGMEQPNRTYPGNGGYRWGYNGMESDPEKNAGRNEYTSYFRQYDARLGRWWSVDPVRQAGESPYAAMGNNPIVASDPLGADTTYNTVDDRYIETKDNDPEQGGRPTLREVNNRTKIWHSHVWDSDRNAWVITGFGYLDDGRSFTPVSDEAYQEYVVAQNLSMAYQQYGATMARYYAGLEAWRREHGANFVLDFLNLLTSDANHTGEMLRKSEAAGMIPGVSMIRAVSLTVDGGLTWGNVGEFGMAGLDMLPGAGFVDEVGEGAIKLVRFADEVADHADEATNGAKKLIGFIDPNDVRFTQNSIGNKLKNGTSIDELARTLRGPNGSEIAKNFEPIRIVQKDGLLWTLDNRRLAIFSASGHQVPFRWATPAEISLEWTKKFSTTAEQGWGRYITIRLPKGFSP